MPPTKITKKWYETCASQGLQTFTKGGPCGVCMAEGRESHSKPMANVGRGGGGGRGRVTGALNLSSQSLVRQANDRNLLLSLPVRLKEKKSPLHHPLSSNSSDAGYLPTYSPPFSRDLHTTGSPSPCKRVVIGCTIRSWHRTAYVRT